MPKISEREARRLKRRNQELENILIWQKNRWRESWVPGWVSIGSISANEPLFASIETARKLSHAVIVICDGPNLRFYADRL